MENFSTFMAMKDTVEAKIRAGGSSRIEKLS